MARFIPRLYLDLEISANTEIIFSKEQSHYLCNVMRKKVGDELLIFNPRGEWKVIISLESKSACQAKVVELTRKPVLCKSLSLYFSPIKQNTEFIIQKATELGVNEIYPIEFNHTIIHKLNMEKLHKIAIEAAEQSERLTIPNIHDMVKFHDLSVNEKIIVCSEKRNYPHLNDLLNTTDSYYAVMIGPEGGFSDKEFKIMNENNHFVFATLSHNVLRSDTAVVVALGCCQAVL